MRFNTEVTDGNASDVGFAVKLPMDTTPPLAMTILRPLDPTVLLEFASHAVPPLLTKSPPLAPWLLPVRAKIPALTTMPPVFVLVPENVSVPVPILISVPLPVSPPL